MRFLCKVRRQFNLYHWSLVALRFSASGHHWRANTNRLVAHDPLTVLRSRWIADVMLLIQLSCYSCLLSIWPFDNILLVICLDSLPFAILCLPKSTYRCHEKHPYLSKRAFVLVTTKRTTGANHLMASPDKPSWANRKEACFSSASHCSSSHPLRLLPLPLSNLSLLVLPRDVRQHFFLYTSYLPYGKCT